MTPEEEGFARRIIACKGWRWRAGMAFLDEEGNQWRVQSQSHADMIHADRLPDLSDAATMGCVLMLARSLWSLAPMTVYCKDEFTVRGGLRYVWVSKFWVGDQWKYVEGNSELEVLVQTIEAAEGTRA